MRRERWAEPGDKARTYIGVLHDEQATPILCTYDVPLCTPTNFTAH